MYHRHLLIDGNYFLHSNTPYNPVDKVGLLTPAYNFLRGISKWQQALHPSRVTVCWDAGIPVRRRQLCPEYKQNRQKIKDKDRNKVEAFTANKDFLKAILPSSGIMSLAVDGMEADDLLFGFATADLDSWTGILSQDMDLAQLITSPKLFMIRPDKPTLSFDNLSSIVLDSKYDMRPRWGRDIIAFKALRGDSSDGIKPILKPKLAKELWTRAMNTGAVLFPEQIRSIATDLGFDLSDKMESMYDTIDLSRSGVAGDAVAWAIQSRASRVVLSDTTMRSMFQQAGMNEGLLRSLVDSFSLLT